MTLRSPAGARCDWLVAILVAANLLWTTLSLGGYRPETMLVSVLLTSLALAGLFARRIMDPRMPRAHAAGWLLLPFLGYAAWNVQVITPVPWLGWSDWLGWAMFVAMYWIGLNALDRPGPRRLVHATIAAAAVIAVGMAVYQRLVDEEWMMLGRVQSGQFIGRASGSFGIPNTFAAFMLLVIFPALAVAFGRTPSGRTGRPLAVVLAAVGLLGLFLTVSRGAWLTLAGTLAVWPLCMGGRRWYWRTGAAVALACAAVGIGLLLYSSVPAVKLRFDALVADSGERTRPVMWRGAWELFQDQPVTGTGAGSYNILFERHRPAHFRDEPQWAHNDYLNTLSDYGAVGFLLFFGAVGLAAARRRSPASADGRDALTLGIGMGLLAFSVSLLIDFHLKIPAMAMIVGLIFAEWIRRRWPLGSGRQETPARWGRAAAAGAGLGLLMFLLAVIVPHQRAESLRYGWRRVIDGMAERGAALVEERELLSKARPALVRAATMRPANGQAWADVSYVTSLWARHEPEHTAELGIEAESMARLALELSEVVPEFWYRLGIALDMQGRWLEASPHFSRALELAPHNAAAWYHQAYHLSLKPATRLHARVAAATCLRLDPGHRSAEDLLRSLAAPSK